MPKTAKPKVKNPFSFQADTIPPKYPIPAELTSLSRELIRDVEDDARYLGWAEDQGSPADHVKAYNAFHLSMHNLCAHIAKLEGTKLPPVELKTHYLIATDTNLPMPRFKKDGLFWQQRDTPPTKLQMIHFVVVIKYTNGVAQVLKDKRGDLSVPPLANIPFAI